MIMQNIVLENIMTRGIAHLDYKNFAGNPTKYDRTGSTRSFALIFDDLDFADKLAAEGWNVHFREFEDTGDRRAKLDIKVSFDNPNYPVYVSMLSSAGEKRLAAPNHMPLDDPNAVDIAILDNAEFSDVDLIIRPRPWTDDDGQRHIKAYLKTMFVTLYEDELMLKHRGQKVSE